MPIKRMPTAWLGVGLPCVMIDNTYHDNGRE